MNLILNVNENLYSVKNSSMGEAKIHSAIAGAMEEIKRQAQVNQKRLQNGQSALPYSANIKDEYGKDLVTIKETKSLGEIRSAYKRRQESFSYDVQESNLLLAMKEIGNSDKNEHYFKENLNKQLNSFLFVNDAQLTPVQERILDYFGDIEGIFSTVSFKEDISIKCIKDLIDLPDPTTGKPPKAFSQLLTNIMNINNIFKNNPNRDSYIETARNYINRQYHSIIPAEFQQFFKNRGDLNLLIDKVDNQALKNKKLNELDFEVSEKNFKQLYQSFCTVEKFKDKPLELASYLTQRVNPAKKEEFVKWMDSIGCKDSASLVKTLVRWAGEVENGKDKDINKNITPKGLRGE